MESNKLTLLLVEDEVLIGLAESRALEKEGYSVVHVLSGEGALVTVKFQWSVHRLDSHGHQSR